MSRFLSAIILMLAGVIATAAFMVVNILHGIEYVWYLSMLHGLIIGSLFANIIINRRQK